MEKKKIRLWKLILLVVIIAIIALLVQPIRNLIIITDLQNKITEYSNSNNYHMKLIVTNEDGLITTTDYYTKDDKKARFIENNNSGEISKILMYYNGERADMFTETKESKIADLDTGMFMDLEISNGLETDNAFQTLLSCFSAKIKKIEYKGKECYSIENFFTPNVMYGLEKNESYIEKETGLEIFNNTDGTVTEKEYEFDIVEDSIFIEPDIGQYKLNINR